MKEVWLDAPEYEGLYEVSNLGRVRRIDSGRILQPTPGTGGYLLVTLSDKGRRTTANVHRLVLTAFCGEPPFKGAQSAHNNGDTDNCALTNLRWASSLENHADMARHNRRCRGEDMHASVLKESDVVEIRRRLPYERNKPIAEDYGVSISTIHMIRHDRIWRHVCMEPGITASMLKFSLGSSKGSN